MRAISIGLVLGLVGMVLVGGSVASAGGAKIELHSTSGVVDLIPGANRGTFTMPLHSANLADGRPVFFVMADASDKDFAEEFGAVRADSLEEAPDAAVEYAEFTDGQWMFNEDPGLVARLDSDGISALAPVANPDYSPLKRFEWDGEVITANMPIVWWGEGAGEALIADHGGCDPLIRSNRPSPFYFGVGPNNARVSCEGEKALDRYKGGQVLDLDLDAMTVTMKLHRATFDHPDDIPYYTVFEASKIPPAGFMGVVHAPKLGNLGRFGDNDAVGRIAQINNGVQINDGGPDRFQQGITSYRGGQQGTYSPMWHISWVMFDCDRDGVFFDAEHNVGEGAVPVPGVGAEFRFDPLDQANFDPFGMDPGDKGVECADVARDITGNSDGFIENLGHLEELVEAGLVIETEGPLGLRLDSPLQPPLVVNCPVPLTVRL